MPPQEETPTLVPDSSWRFKLWSGLLWMDEFVASRSWRGRYRISLLKKRLIGDRYIRVPYLGTGSIWICPYHTMGEDVFSRGLYEPQVIKAVQSFVSSGFSFVDVGANLGLHTVAAGLSLTSNDQQFFALEPEPKALFLLQRNCDLNKLNFVKVMHLAAGEKEATANLYVSTTYNQGRHSLIQHWQSVKVSSCSMTTLDKLFLSGPDRIVGPVLLKIDVEGAEPEVLAGGLDWLKQVEELSIICEISKVLLQHSEHSPADVISLLRQIGCEHFFLSEDNSSDPWLPMEDESIIDSLGDKWMNVLATKGEAALRASEKLMARLALPQ